MFSFTRRSSHQKDVMKLLTRAFSKLAKKSQSTCKSRCFGTFSNIRFSPKKVIDKNKDKKFDKMFDKKIDKKKDVDTDIDIDFVVEVV